MMEHTEGPWMVSRDAFEIAVYSKLEDGCRGDRICRLEDHSDETRGKAQLIAAAPDMYAALKKIEYIIDAFGFEICPCCEYYNDSGHHPNCAVAQALAKAEGK